MEEESVAPDGVEEVMSEDTSVSDAGSIPYARFKAEVDKCKLLRGELQVSKDNLTASRSSLETQKLDFEKRYLDLENNVKSERLDFEIKNTLLSESVDPDKVKDLMDFVVPKFKAFKPEEGVEAPGFKEFFETFKVDKAYLVSSFLKQEDAVEDINPVKAKRVRTKKDSSFKDVDASKPSVSQMSPDQISKLTSKEWAEMKSDIMKQYKR